MTNDECRMTNVEWDQTTADLPRLSTINSPPSTFPQHPHEFAHQRRVIMPGAGADQVAIDDVIAVDVFRAALLDVELALGDGGQRAALDDTGGGEDLDAVADHGDGLVLFEEVTGDAEEVFVVAQILRRTSAGNEESRVFLWFHVLERHGRAHMIGRAGARGGPGRRG